MSAPTLGFRLRLTLPFFYALPLFATAETPPLWNQADAYFDPEAMAAAREDVIAEAGGQQYLYLMLDQFEYQHADAEELLVWDGFASYAGDIHKFILMTEGESSLDGEGVEEAEIQLRYARAVAPFWDLHLGVRQDLEPEAMSYFSFGASGLAPYWFEVDAVGFLSEDGDLTARVEAEYDLLLTQRLILQPSVEVNLSAQNSADDTISSGLYGIEAGLRLRYELRREVAPYVGIEWRSLFGDSKDAVAAAGGDASEALFVAGIRLWY